MKHLAVVLALLLFAAPLSAAPPPPPLPAAPAEIGSSSGFVFGPWSAATFDEAFVTHDITGDKTLLFVTCAYGTDLGVRVIKRISGSEIALLPVPARGWNHPFLARMVSFRQRGLSTSGRLLILDGIHPAQILMRGSYLYEYAYDYSPRAGFSAAIVSEHYLPPPTSDVLHGELPNAMVFPTSISVLPEGHLVAADTFTGTLWATGDNWDDWFLALGSAEFGAKPLGSGMVTCLDGTERQGFYVNAVGPDGHVHQYPYAIHALAGVALEPGLHGSAYIDLLDKVAFNIVAAPGGIWMADRSVVLDRSANPFLKPYTPVLQPIDGITDWVGEIEYDNYHPTSPWLYFQRAVAGYCLNAESHPYCRKANPLYRVDVRSGRIEFVKEDLHVWDFISNNNILPPIGNEPATYITSNNTRQHLWPEPNACLNESILFPPTRVPVIAIFGAP